MRHKSLQITVYLLVLVLLLVACQKSGGSAVTEPLIHNETQQLAIETTMDDKDSSSSADLNPSLSSEQELNKFLHVEEMDLYRPSEQSDSKYDQYIERLKAQREKLQFNYDPSISVTESDLAKPAFELVTRSGKHVVLTVAEVNALLGEFYRVFVQPGIFTAEGNQSLDENLAELSYKDVESRKAFGNYISRALVNKYLYDTLTQNPTMIPDYLSEQEIEIAKLSGEIAAAVSVTNLVNLYKYEDSYKDTTFATAFGPGATPELVQDLNARNIFVQNITGKLCRVSDQVIQNDLQNNLVNYSDIVFSEYNFPRHLGDKTEQETRDFILDKLAGVSDAESWSNAIQEINAAYGREEINADELQPHSVPASVGFPQQYLDWFGAQERKTGDWTILEQTDTDTFAVLYFDSLSLKEENSYLGPVFSLRLTLDENSDSTVLEQKVRPLLAEISSKYPHDAISFLKACQTELLPLAADYNLVAEYKRSSEAYELTGVSDWLAEKHSDGDIYMQIDNEKGLLYFYEGTQMTAHSLSAEKLSAVKMSLIYLNILENSEINALEGAGLIGYHE